jgi:methylamine dehydrogenase accessory protein MauD
MDGFWLVSYVVLWLVVVLEAIVILALARQVGLLAVRVGPVGARMTNHGPKIGDPAPPLDTTDIAGRKVVLGANHNKRTLLLFMSPKCSSCQELLPGLRTLARTERSDLDIVLVSAEQDVAVNREYVEQHRLQSMPLIIGDDIAVLYQVGSLPYAVLVSKEGAVSAKGLVNNKAQLESLLNADEVGHASIQSYLERDHQPA